MFKVLHTVASLRPESGGPARTVTGLCSSLAEIPGIDVRLATQRLPNESIYSGGLSPEILKIFSSPDRFHYSSGRSSRTCLQATTKDFQPDIIHDHGIWLPANHVVRKFAEERGAVRVLHSRGMLMPWALSFSKFKKRVIWAMYQKRDLSKANLFFATSQQEAQSIRELGFGQPIAVIPNGIDIAEKPVYKHKKKPGRRQLVFMSRIHPKKGILDLVRAWRALDDVNWELIIAGPSEGGHIEVVQGLVRRFNLEETVKIIGAVDDSGKTKLLNSADLFVLPSYSENFGVVVAEALSAGTPVITTKATPWEQLDERGCGWCISTGLESLTKALRVAMDLSDDQRMEMGYKAMTYASKFSWQAIAHETVSVYSWLLGMSEKPESVVD
jgi:glycosyltransferase involved in cell wall biosynthesis